MFFFYTPAPTTFGSQDENRKNSHISDSQKNDGYSEDEGNENMASKDNLSPLRNQAERKRKLSWTSRTPKQSRGRASALSQNKKFPSSPHLLWSKLGGRPDFRPSSGCRVGGKRRRLDFTVHEEAYRSQDEPGNEVKVIDNQSYSWKSWYDWERLDSIIAKTSNNSVQNPASIQSAANELSTGSSNNQLDDSKSNLYELFREERNAAIKLEKKLVKLIE